MAKKPELKGGETNERPTPRCMLFRGQESKIFKGEDAIDAALEDGWDDEPAEQPAQSDNSDAVVDKCLARIDELEQFLQDATDAVDAEKARADTAEATAAAEKKRADAAEKKLAGATKK